MQILCYINLNKELLCRMTYIEGDIVVNIWFNQYGMPKSCENYIATPDLWFDNQGGEEYITGDVERQMIKDIDDSEVVSNFVLLHPVLGSVPVNEISGCVKTLILIKNEPEYIFNGSYMGNKCADWLLCLGNITDITFRLGYLM